MKDEALRLALDALKTCQIDGDGWSGPHYWFDSEKVGKAITAGKQALEQPEPEPVAAIQHWCTYCQGHNAHNCQFNTQLPRVHTYTTNHTSPPKCEWQGLTEDEIKECFKITPDLFLPWHIYKRIETKLKEKNNG